MRVIESVRFGG